MSLTVPGKNTARRTNHPGVKLSRPPAVVINEGDAVTDDDLVTRCLRNEATAMRTLVERFQSDVFALSFRLLRHRQDAEDVTQDVFVRVFRSLGKWDAARPLRPWIQAIAVNRCRTQLGRRGRIPQPVEHLNAVPDRPQTTPPSELVRAIEVAVAGLRGEYREVFVLFHEHGQSYEDIGIALDRPVGTIKTWLHRARAQVLDALRKLGLAPDDLEPSETMRTRTPTGS